MTPVQPSDPVATTEVESATNTRIQGMFSNLVDSLADMLTDITALEVNTMIVSEITGGKFVPESAYLNIYYCLTPDQTIPDVLRSHFEERGITDPGTDGIRYKYGSFDRTLAEQYWKLREKLERDSRFIFDCDEACTHLPHPAGKEGWNKMEELLKNSRFLSSLRKVMELKSTLGDKKRTVDIIYAQTVMQLDGDVINRFDKRLFKLPPEQKDLILRIHQDGVLSGEEQWRELWRFAVDLVANIGEKLKKSNSGPKGLFQQNGRQ